MEADLNELAEKVREIEAKASSRIDVLDRLLQSGSVDVRELREQLRETDLRLQDSFRKGEEKHRQSIDETRTSLEKLVADVDASISEFNSSLTRRITGLENNLTETSKIVQKPWFADKKFWGGVSAIPLLILGGWFAKATFQDAAVLRLIHKGFGTEVAMSAALGDESDVRKQIEIVVREEIDPSASSIAGALENKLGPIFVSRSSLTKDLRREIGIQFRVQHVAVMAVGLLEMDAIEFTDGAIGFQDAHESTSTTVFGGLPGQKMDISIGVNIIKVDLDKVRAAREEPDPDTANALLTSSLTPDSTEMHDALAVFLDGEELTLERQNASYDYTIGDETHRLQHYQARGVVIPDDRGSEKFPLRTLTLETRPGYEDLILTSIVVVSREDNSD